MYQNVFCTSSSRDSTLQGNQAVQAPLFAKARPRGWESPDCGWRHNFHYIGRKVSLPGKAVGYMPEHCSIMWKWSNAKVLLILVVLSERGAAANLGVELTLAGLVAFQSWFRPFQCSQRSFWSIRDPISFPNCICLVTGGPFPSWMQDSRYASDASSWLVAP